MSYLGNVGSPYNYTTIGTTGWLDTGDNSWQLTAASLVGLQSMAGLTILYSPPSSVRFTSNNLSHTDMRE
jgi:hypothetical protein